MARSKEANAVPGTWNWLDRTGRLAAMEGRRLTDGIGPNLAGSSGRARPPRWAPLRLEESSGRASHGELSSGPRYQGVGSLRTSCRGRVRRRLGRESPRCAPRVRDVDARSDV